MKLTPILLTIVLITACSRNESIPEFHKLTYQVHGSRRHNELQVIITKDDLVNVSYTRYNSHSVDYHTHLSQAESVRLLSLVQSLEIPVPEKSNQMIPRHTGAQELLTIQVGEQTKPIIFEHHISFQPLRHFLSQLVVQADSLDAIEHNENFYSATSAVNQKHAGVKALQPEKFKSPLYNYIQKTDDQQHLQWAFESLAWITTPAEFHDFIALELKNQKKQTVLLNTIATFWIPETHLNALCPIFLSYLETYQKTPCELTDMERSIVAYQFSYLLGKCRYKKAIPFFRTYLEQYDKPYLTSVHYPLSMMGASGLETLTPFLEHKKEHLRLNAIELIVRASKYYPDNNITDPLPASEYENMVPHYRDTILPKLRDLSKNDSSERVNIKAAEAVIEIKLNMKNSNQQVEPIVTTPVDKVEAQSTQAHP